VAVGDDEGVIVIPRYLVEEVAAASSTQEQEEQFIESEILRGASIIGLYPMNADNHKRYEESKRS
jgi:regulator of RNase E activity RraA